MCGEMLDWLYQDASRNLKMAAKWHDIGKKIDLRSDYAKYINSLNNQPDERRRVLTDDFYRRRTVDSVTPDESAKAYVKFLRNPEKKHIRAQRGGYHLDPPFGFHASTVQYDDLPKGLEDSDRSYIINLIHLHHRFSPEQLVEAAADHGQEILDDLYKLIVADHFASEWVTKVVNQIENVEGQEYRGEMRFAEKIIETKKKAQIVKREGNVVFGQITLNCESQQLTINVNYYRQDFHFDGKQAKP